MAADEYNQSVVVHQGTSQEICLKNTGNDLIANCSVSILKPGTSSFGAVTNTAPIAKVTLTSGYYYVWNADDVDLDTTGVNIVRLTVPSATISSYTYVNIIDAIPVVPDIAPRPAL